MSDKKEKIEKLEFDDWKKLNDLVLQMRELIYGYKERLKECENCKDLEILSRLTVRLDKVEQITMNECCDRYNNCDEFNFEEYNLW